ncbi:MAG: glycoside hydrolase family 36 protein [Candidatus Sulfotelmatobacter sp.]
MQFWARDMVKFICSAKGEWPLAIALVLSLVPCAGAAADFTIGNPQLSVTVNERDGSYEIKNSSSPVLHSYVAAQIDQHWVKSNDYPSHEIKRSDFDDALGHGQQLTVTCGGVVGRPNLIYVIRIYEQFPFGDIDVQVQNHTARTLSVQALRSVDAQGNGVVNLGGLEGSERVLSDTFSESHLQVHDLAPVPQGMHVAVGSQLIYNRESKQGLFFGALSADRLLTILRLQVEDAQRGTRTKSYTIDSTGTTEIKMMSKWFRELSPENRVQLSLPVSPGTSISSERLMFAVGSDYHAMLENYGTAIRKLHHARVDGPSLMGWWTSPMEYNFTVNEGQAATNAQWLAQHLKRLGYDFFQIDSPYLYSFGEYTHPNARMYPHGMRELGAEVSELGLKFGIWVSPFEVGERSWVFKHHQDWLLQNSRGQPIVGPPVELNERFSILDTTHPGAQAHLRQTYQTLTREWGLRYIKLDFMDMTAVEGNYHQPHTTALEALRIGLQVIRDAVGDDVLLDKDGSPMLTPVGIVDEGRVSNDAGHSFAVWKDRSPGILARYYMHRNFFVNDPDAFTLLKEVPKVPMFDADYNNIAWGTLTGC